MLLGVQVSSRGGFPEVIQRAERFGINVVQFFSRNPRSFRARPIGGREIDDFLNRKLSSGVKMVFLHLPYLINLASPDEDIFRKSCDVLYEDLMLADRLGAEGVVTHIGSHMGRGRAYGLRRIINALDEVFSRYIPRSILLLENSSGGGFSIGTLEEIMNIINGGGYREYLGVCLDTAHAYSCGYNIDNPEILDRISSLLGRRLRLIHINDLKTGFNCRIDRHEHIGRGQIGIEAFRRILRHPLFRGLPFILETPRKDDIDDLRNLQLIRALLKG